jgi:hypothetical protein
MGRKTESLPQNISPDPINKEYNDFFAISNAA